MKTRFPTILRDRPRAIMAGAGGLATLAFLTLAMPAPAGAGGNPPLIPTTEADFTLDGTQPDPTGAVVEPILPSINCSFCHSDYVPTVAPFDSWIASMKGLAARDPVWHAAIALADHDADFSGTFCIRCHAPGPWLGGRATTGDFSQFDPFSDFDGINCNFCHRVVNPVLGPDSAVGYPENADPTPDPEVLAPLAAAGLLPQERGNAMYVVDPVDVRRGPFADVSQNFHPVDLVHSPFHTKGDFCGTCHDVSNPAFVPGPNGTLVLGAVNTPHPTGDPDDMFPEQRTFSEWKNSLFASQGVHFPDGRFGGNHPTGIMQSCQDCHMPDQEGAGCIFFDGDPKNTRPNVPQHSFAGANTWVPRAIRLQDPLVADDIGLTEPRVDAAQSRVVQMLRDASDMELTQAGSSLRVRVINQCGHKLPTGYPEGRRAWLNVRFLDASGSLLSEHGAYDFATATASVEDTKVYETHQTFDQHVADATGLPAGTQFHIALNNSIPFDNRIPPRGFTNAAFAAAGAQPRGYTYADGQYWDDTDFAIPPGAARAVVTLWYQTSTREYMEFLRDTPGTGANGPVVYDLWVQAGKSAPVDMDNAQIDLVPSNPADLNGDGDVDGIDLALLLSNWGASGMGDIDGSGLVDGLDLAVLLGGWG